MTMKIQFKQRNESGLHCRFCKDRHEYGVILFETSPIKGIVCINCKSHLEEYLD